MQRGLLWCIAAIGPILVGAWASAPRPLSSVGRGIPQLAQLPVPQQSRSTSSASPSPAPVLAFTGVIVVDVTDGRHLSDQTVVIIGNRVQAVGRTGQVRVPVEAQVVEARGKYLIPGLWDMHAHVKEFSKVFYPRLIANGVTGIRDMAQVFKGGADSFRVWQREVAAGTRIGPRAVGPSADIGYMFDEGITTEDEARRIIDSLKVAGMAFYKYHHDRGRQNVFFALLHEGRRVGLPVVGHVPIGANIAAADSGMRSVEHANYRECWHRPSVDSLATEQECARLASAYIRNGTWLTPTLIAHYYLSPVESREQRTAVVLTRKLYQLGVRRFLAGTDFTQSTYVRSGCSVRDELVFLVDAGLTPLEALQAGTLNPAKFFEATDSLGVVAPGKLADLVLLDADPLADIKHLRTIRAVVANGRYFDRAALDALDPDGLTAREDLAKYYGFKGRWPSLWGEPSHSCS